MEELRYNVSTSLRYAKIPTLNISKAECLAVRSLASDKNIVIVPADKGRCVVVLNEEDFHDRCVILLENKKKQTRSLLTIPLVVFLLWNEVFVC